MKNILKNIDKSFYVPLILNFSLIGAETLYLALRFKYLNNQIPFWMTLPWGVDQLAAKTNIFLIPLLALIITVLGIIFIANAKARYQRYGGVTLIGIITSVNLLLTYSTLRIIRVASNVFDPLIDPRFNQILLPALFAFLIVYFISPKFIEKFEELGIITDPKKHKHPGMLLSKPSARGGGIIFIVGVITTSIFFIRPSPMMLGIFASAILAAILGYLDDVQNTKPQSKLTWLENPTKRFFLQVLVVLPLIVSGVVVKSINNPFNGLLHLDALKFNFMNIELTPIAVIFTIVWVVWIMNLLSWSNGVDGQYSGVIGIAGLMVAIITLRLLHFDPKQKDMMELAAIVAGASLGLLRYGWHPSRIMWGFGAISAGIILGAISVVSRAKIATSIIVLTVPFLDGAITATRRVLLKQSPFRGDSGHLHHLLLKRGWSVKRVAVFYWVTTALFGLSAVFAADKDPILAAMTGIGLVAFTIISLNLSSKK